MRKIKEILRLKWSLGLSHREIAQRCGISTGAISETLVRAQRAGLSWPLAEGDEAQLESRLFPPLPPTGVPDRAPPDWKEVHLELRRQGVTLLLLWQEYLLKSPNGYRYTQFCVGYRRWLQHQKRSMRQVHIGGDKLFVDYSGKRPSIVDPATGVAIKVELFVAVLGASSLTYAEATMTQQSHDWIASHIRAFEYIAGVTRTIVPDCLKSGVTDPCWYDPIVQRTYEEMACHYGSTVLPARPRHPKDKAKAEVGVQVVQRWILARIRNQTFFSLEDLNRRIAELLEDVNNRIMRRYGASRRELFERLDREALAPLPPTRFVFAEWKHGRVDMDYHIDLDGHRYSVPHQYAHKKVEIRFTATMVEVLCRSRRIASHFRSAVKGGASTVPAHMPKAHQAHLEWTPSRLIAWAATIGVATKVVVEHTLASQPHPERGYRTCLGFMRLAKLCGKDRLEASCFRAVAIGAPTYRSVKSMLDARLEHAPIPGQEATQQLSLGYHANVRGSSYYHDGNDPTASIARDLGQDPGEPGNPQSIEELRAALADRCATPTFAVTLVPPTHIDSEGDHHA